MATSRTSPEPGILARATDLFFDTARHRLIDVETTQDGGPVNGRVEVQSGQSAPDDGLRGAGPEGQGMNLTAIMVLGGLLLGGVWLVSELAD